jgi:trk system potassium uptake protein TrkA
MPLQVAIFGLGRFGLALSVELAQKGYSVMAVDMDRDKVERVRNILDKVHVMKHYDEESLKNTGVAECEVAVVAFGKNIENNILLTSMLKEIGVPYVISRAESHIHAKILQKIGADDIFSPEEDMAVRILNRITGTSFLDFIEISDEFAITEFPIPNEWKCKMISELNLRGQMGIIIVAIRREGQVIMPPDPTSPLCDNDLLIAIGPRLKLDEISKKARYQEINE